MKKEIFIFVYWLLLFQYALVYIGGDFFDIFDKLFVVFCGFSLLNYSNRVNVKYLLLYLSLLAIGLYGNLKYNYVKFNAIFNDFFLFLKFPLCLFAGYIYGNSKTNLYFELKYIKRYSPKIATMFFLLCVICQFVDLFPRYEDNLGPIKCLELFFGHCTFMAATLIFYVSLYLTIIKKNTMNSLVFFMFVFSIITTTRMKAIAVLLLILYLYYRYSYSRVVKFKKGEFFVFAVFLLLFAIDKIIFYFVDYSDYARGLLFFNAVDIAKTHFPLGAGIGSFASSSSVRYLSPLYAQYGMYHHFFAADSFLATILSQFGFLGLFIFLLLIIILVVRLFTMTMYPRIFMSCLVLVSYLLICSIAEVSFIAVYSVPMAFWIGVLLGYVKNEKKVQGKLNSL